MVYASVREVGGEPSAESAAVGAGPVGTQQADVFRADRGLLRPFGIKLGSRQGTKKFDEAARLACCHDDLLYACVNALLEALAAIEAQIAPWTSRFRRG